MKPQSFIRILGDLWPLVSAIWQKYESKTLGEPELARLVASFHSSDEVYAVITRMTQAGILSEFHRGGRGFEINAQLTPFIQFLLNEQKLGLLAEITANANHLEVHLNEIATTLAEGRRTGYFEKCLDMQARFQVLRRMVEANTQAICRLADEAKQANQTIPLNQRYAKVIQAWDEYISPALQMRNPGQPFDTVMMRITREIHAWLGNPGLHLLSYDDARRELDIIQFRQMDFKEKLERSIDLMARQLAPMVQHARISTQVAQGAAIALRELTSQGRALEDDFDLRLPGKKRLNRKPDEDALAAFYGEFMQDVVVDPEILIDTVPSVAATAERRRRSNVPAIVQWLKDHKPVHDIIQELQGAFPDAEPITLLSALNDLILSEATRRHVVRQSDQRTYSFAGQVIRMHRRSLELTKAPYRQPPRAELDEDIVIARQRSAQ